MSTIDELQKMHEDSIANGCVGFWRSEHEAAMFAAWPVIHRVLVAAREVAGNTADDIDSRLRYVEVRPGRDEWNELREALRALDGGAKHAMGDAIEAAERAGVRL